MESQQRCQEADDGVPEVAEMMFALDVLEEDLGAEFHIVFEDFAASCGRLRAVHIGIHLVAELQTAVIQVAGADHRDVIV